MDEIKDKNKVKKNDKKKGCISKKKKIALIIIGVVLVILVTVLVCFFVNKNNKHKPEDIVNVTEVSDRIDKYGYSLNKNVTDYYKDEFNKLKNLSNEEEIAKQVAKLFVIDLFSMDYKINKYEVTSAQYFYSDKRDMHRNKVMDNLYNLMEDNSYGDRKQKLPEVTNVEVSDVKKDNYSLGDKKVDSYVVNLTISYKENLGYDTKGEVILVKDNDNISVVSYKSIKG